MSETVDEKPDPDTDNNFDEPDPSKDGDDSVLAERYGGSNHGPS